MQVMSEAANDVRRVLTIAFRGRESIGQMDMERFLSFDMEWVAPHEAEQAVQSLIKAGWLDLNEGALTLSVELGAISVPLGWFPRPSRLLAPVGVLEGETETPATPGQPVATNHPSPVRQVKPMTIDSADPRSRLTQRLVKFIARKSGLEATELQRRAERKISAFHNITPWLAYALVAREQGLAMQDIVDALAVV